MDKWLLELVHSLNGYGILIYVLITTVAAALLSFCIGLERQLRGEQAGVRTHALLAVGASLLMTLGIWALRIADGQSLAGAANLDLNYDISRIAAAVITGIGFLGGGVIIKDKLSVRGLSTANTLWLCTAIGLACGVGFVLEAVIFTAVVLGVLIVFGKALDYIDSLCPFVVITADAGCPIIERVRSVIAANELPLKSIHVLRCAEGETLIHVSFSYYTQIQTIRYFRALIAEEPGVRSVSEPINRYGRRETDRPGFERDED